MRTHLFFKTFFAACGLVMGALSQAQTPPAPDSAAGAVRDETVLDRHTQRVEQIQIEDAGARVNETRVGGETQSITVQPKSGAPAYDVLPSGRSGSREAAPGGTGPRVWKLHQF